MDTPEKTCSNAACQMPHSRRHAQLCVACEAESTVETWRRGADRVRGDADRRAAYWEGLAANARSMGKDLKAKGYDNQAAKVRKERDRMLRFYNRKIERDVERAARSRLRQAKFAVRLAAAGTPVPGTMWAPLADENRGRS